MSPKKKTTTKKRVPVKKRVAAPKRKAVPKKTTKASVAKKAAVPTHDSTTVPLVMYRRIAVGFVVIVAFALMSVLYLATMQAVVHVDAVETVIESEYIISAVEVATSETDVPAEIFNGTLGKTVEVAPTGDGSVEIDAVATGQLSIHNNMTFAQPLVATTRFLSADGVLFRLSNQVNVPAGGTVDAEVYADVEGASGNIAATHFTIPGLSAAKQELVYADSAEVFVGGTFTRAVVSEAEMNTAADTLSGELLQDAMSMFREEAMAGYDGELFDVNIQEKSFSIEPNTEADGYEVTMTIEIGAVFYNTEVLENLVVRKLYEGLGQGQEFVDTGLGDLEISIESYSDEDGEASLLTSLKGRAITSRASDALSVERFVGLSGDEVSSLLVGEGVAENVWVEFFPFWVNSIPQLKDHIYIEIE